MGKLFDGVRFFLAGLDRDEEHELRSLVVENGGCAAADFPECNHVIVSGLGYDDPICVAARKEGKELVTKSWVQDCLKLEALTDTSSALYMPLRDPRGIPECRSLCICVTGYRGHERQEIGRMVTMMGAKLTLPYIPRMVTHLICHKFEGEKYRSATNNKVAIVNHLWLEDSLKTWSRKNEKDYALSGEEAAQLKDSQAKEQAPLSPASVLGNKRNVGNGLASPQKRQGPEGEQQVTQANQAPLTPASVLGNKRNVANGLASPQKRQGTEGEQQVTQGNEGEEQATPEKMTSLKSSKKRTVQSARASRTKSSKEKRKPPSTRRDELADFEEPAGLVRKGTTRKKKSPHLLKQTSAPNEVIVLDMDTDDDRTTKKSAIATKDHKGEAEVKPSEVEENRMAQPADPVADILRAQAEAISVPSEVSKKRKSSDAEDTVTPMVTKTRKARCEEEVSIASDGDCNNKRCSLKEVAMNQDDKARDQEVSPLSETRDPPFIGSPNASPSKRKIDGSAGPENIEIEVPKTKDNSSCPETIKEVNSTDCNTGGSGGKKPRLETQQQRDSSSGARSINNLGAANIGASEKLDRERKDAVSRDGLACNGNDTSISKKIEAQEAGQRFFSADTAELASPGENCAGLPSTSPVSEVQQGSSVSAAQAKKCPEEENTRRQKASTSERGDKKNANAAVKRVFALTGHTQEKASCRNIVKSLKGRLVEGHTWKEQITHLIIPAPLRRTEKLLAAIASGKWVLRADYLHACKEAGCFVNEEAYEWHDSGFNAEGNVDYGAPRLWRKRKEKFGYGAFRGLRFVIYGETELPVDILRRAIKAGGGCLLAWSPPYHSYLASGVDFAICAEGLPEDDKHVARFLKKEIACVGARYVVDFICKPHSSLDAHILYGTKQAEVAIRRRFEEINEVDDDYPCSVCLSKGDADKMLLCGDDKERGCNVAKHTFCCVPPLERVPEGSWFCSRCER